MEPLRWAGLDSPLGPLWLAATPGGLAALDIGGRRAPLQAWRRRFGRAAVRDDAALAPWAGELRGYFAGEVKRFRAPVDLLGGTPFQRRVWAALRTIPHGQTRSYKWLAAEVGTARGFRAVGAANGANPVAIVVPCHRVVNADGGLGGYGGGLGAKRALLRLEGSLPARGRAQLSG